MKLIEKQYFRTLTFTLKAYNLSSLLTLKFKLSIFTFTCADIIASQGFPVRGKDRRRNLFIDACIS